MIGFGLAFMLAQRSVNWPVTPLSQVSDLTVNGARATYMLCAPTIMCDAPHESCRRYTNDELLLLNSQQVCYSF